jgi:hypothetical protein
MQKLAGDGWIKAAKTTQAYPRMPWHNLRGMADQDLIAACQFTGY